jgi:hypothetical protein
MWSTPKLDEIRLLIEAARNIDTAQAALLAAVPLGIGLAAPILGRRTREHTEGTRSKAVRGADPFWPSAIRVGLCAGALVFVAVKPWALLSQPQLVSLVGDLRDRRLNKTDAAALHRGYYEELGDVTRFDNELWRLYGLEPKDWGREIATMDDREDAIIYAYRPGLHGITKRAMFTTNSEGLRDREYTQEKPAGTFRIALIGSSHDVGSGVADGEPYESVLENRLNDGWGGPNRRFEVLNFSVSGYSAIQKLAVSEIRVPEYQPDVVVYAASGQEADWTFFRLEDLIRRGIVKEYPFFVEAMQAAGLDPEGQPEPQLTLERRLASQESVVLGEILERFSDSARRNGAVPVLLLVEHPGDEKRPDTCTELADLGRRAGAEVIDLYGAFASIRDRSTLWVAPWDDHTNALGHRLLGERLLQLLVEKGLVPVEGEPRRASGE